MARSARQHSPSEIYHAISRGAGRRTLFEDDNDRSFYMRRLRSASESSSVGILAWCLMENHVHLLLRGHLESLESMMRSLNTSYARRFNGRHGHVGPVFQGRFKSVPVANDSHLLEVVRYIHLNPQVAGIGRCAEYRWSSYSALLGAKTPCGVDQDFVMDAFGGRGEFERFHRDAPAAQELLEFGSYDGKTGIKRRGLTDAEARELIASEYGNDFADQIASLGRLERNAALSKQLRKGISVRQLERLTGIGRGIIQKCDQIG